MNKITPVIRASLASDAASFALRHWSIAELVRCGPQANAPIATKILQDVQIRLAMQHDKCSTMFERVSDFLDRIDSCSHHLNRKKKPVIKALNHPVSSIAKEHVRRASIARAEGGKSLKFLRDISLLHENTYLLPYQLIHGDGQAAIESFSKAHQRIVSDTFDEIMCRHGTSVETLADTVIASRNMQDILSVGKGGLGTEEEALDNHLIESFLQSRLLIQLLCDHFVALSKGRINGCVSVDADVVGIVDDAVTEAKHVCDANLGMAPHVHIESPNSSCRATLIRPWIHHAVVEITKNAMTSTIEQWKQQGVAEDALPPPVHIEIVRKADDSILIHVMDQGVGLDEVRTEKSFRFADSTSRKRWDRLEEQQSYAEVRQPLGSLGVGLSLSRMMMRVFGGDLHLRNRLNGSKSADDQPLLESGCTATLKIINDDDFVASN